GLAADVWSRRSTAAGDAAPGWQYHLGTPALVAIARETADACRTRSFRWRRNTGGRADPGEVGRCVVIATTQPAQHAHPGRWCGEHRRLDLTEESGDARRVLQRRRREWDARSGRITKPDRPAYARPARQ